MPEELLVEYAISYKQEFWKIMILEHENYIRENTTAGQYLIVEKKIMIRPVEIARLTCGSKTS